jgi:hypothetical protein
MNGWARRGRRYLASTMYAFNKARQLDGTISEGSKYGSYCLTAARVLMGWGSVSYNRWPTPRGLVQWPPNEPPGLDWELSPIFGDGLVNQAAENLA